MRASKATTFRKNILRILGVGALATHLAAAQDDCTIRFVVDIAEGEGEGEGEDVDSDGDGLLDRDERAFGTDPHNADTDFDGLQDGHEARCALSGPDAPEYAGAPGMVAGCCTDPTNPDSDFDGVPDGADTCDDVWLDSDGDGLLDIDENGFGTDPYNPDTDFDGLIDSNEVWCVFALPVEHSDDSDGERRQDDAAVIPAPACCTDPRNADTDFDGIPDGVDDTCEEQPWIDSDGDGLDDATEQALGTDPFHADTDGDHLDDGTELAVGLDPLNADSDGDGVLDGEEFARDARERP
jgi:hypothetical protein